MAEKKKLTAKQIAFCEHYLISQSVTEAALAAGFSTGSREHAATVGSRLFKKPEIRKHIQKLMDARSKRTGVTADFVLNELYQIASIDLSDAYDDRGKLKPVKEMPKELRRAISSIETFEEYEGAGRDRVYIGDTVKVKFWDKPKALEMLGRHLKLFTDKVEIGVSESLAKRLELAKKRASE